MKKKKHRINVPIGGPFTPILYQLHDSVAFQELTGNSAKLYTYLVRVARTVAVRSGNYDEGKVEFDYTYTEAKSRGFSPATFKRCMQELWNKGFISLRKSGGLFASGGHGRISSSYQLCGFWATYKASNGGWTDRTKFESDPWAIHSEPVGR